jgi:enamine deaminase RidA (YjgF/YER057c/UK114 family)
MTAFRETHRTGGFENVGGYSRAVRSGTHIAVSGTAATDVEGRALAPGDVGGQTAEAFKRALDAVAALGGSTGDVIRTRIFLVAGSDWREAVAVHLDLFAEVAPANTTVFVSGFPPEGVLVEVEVDAILSG